jgi:hypothetical protein
MEGTYWHTQTVSSYALLQITSLYVEFLRHLDKDSCLACVQHQITVGADPLYDLLQAVWLAGFEWLW